MSHLAVVSSFLIQFGTTARMSSIADGGGSHAGGKCLGEKDTSVTEVIMHVRYCCIVVAEDGGLDRV